MEFVIILRCSIPMMHIQLQITSLFDYSIFFSFVILNFGILNFLTFVFFFFLFFVTLFYFYFSLSCILFCFIEERIQHLFISLTLKKENMLGLLYSPYREWLSEVVKNFF